jgi:hypothetical protein
MLAQRVQSLNTKTTTGAVTAPLFRVAKPERRCAAPGGSVQATATTGKREPAPGAKATGSARPADRPCCSVPASARNSTGRASGSPGAGHIQQLQRLGSVERDQTGQRTSAGQELDQRADVGGWVLVVACAGRDARGGAGGRAGCRRSRRDRGLQASTRPKATGPAGPADRPGYSVPALARASGLPGAGHIQQLQRPGSVEHDQSGQRADVPASAHRLTRRFSQEAASGCPV